MSTQEISVTTSSYYYMGLMNILELLVKRISIIQGVFGNYIPILKTSWITPWNDIISPIMLRFGLAKMINNAMPDKPTMQGDGSITPWSMSKSQADIQAMYYALKDAGVVFNPNEPIDATLDKIGLQDPTIYQLRFLRCQSMMTSYEAIHEIENNIYVILFSINSLYKTDSSLNKSPGQLLTISGGAINKPYLFNIVGLGSVVVSWETISSIITSYFTKEYLDNTIFRYDITLPVHSTIDKNGTVAYTGEDIELNVEETGKKVVACIRLHLSGIDSSTPPLPVESDINITHIDSTTLYVSSTLLSQYKNPSDINWTASIIYVND